MAKKELTPEEQRRRQVGAPRGTVFLAMAQTGRRLTSWWLSIIMLLVLMFAGAIIGFTLLSLSQGMSGIASGFAMLDADQEGSVFALDQLSSAELGLFLLASTAPTGLLFLLWMRFFEGRSFASMGLANVFTTGLLQFGRGALLGSAAIAGMTFALVGMGYAAIGAVEVPSAWIIVWPLLLLMFGWAVQSTQEEIIVRGFLLQAFGGRYGLIWGLVISSAFFTLLHGANPNSTAIFFGELMIYSVFAVFYTLRERSLWGISGYHAAWNFTQGSVFSFNVSGQTTGTDQLASVTVQGPDWITGGAAGLEGGVISMAASAASFLLVLLIVRPKGDEAV